MNKIKFTIPGTPGQDRHQSAARKAKSGRMFVVHYPDKGNKMFRNLVKMAWDTALGDKGIDAFPPHLGPVRMKVKAFFLQPKTGWPKWRREAHAIKPEACLKKPDAVNIFKAVEEGLKGIAFRDDSQVFCIADKYWSDVARTEIEIQFFPLRTREIAERIIRDKEKENNGNNAKSDHRRDN